MFMLIVVTDNYLSHIWKYYCTSCYVYGGNANDSYQHMHMSVTDSTIWQYFDSHSRTVIYLILNNTKN